MRGFVGLDRGRAAQDLCRHPRACEGNYDGVLRIDGEMGDKKTYDPRAYMKKAQDGMKARVVQAIEELRGTGKTLFRR